MELTSNNTIASILERHKAQLLADWLKELQNTGLRPDQGKRILSITRGFSTADSALLLFIENGFSTCSALVSTQTL
jgi:hypothetical protein